MSEVDFRPAKIFTVDEANRTLPLIGAIVQDLVDLANDVMERRQRLAHLTAGRDMDATDPYCEELAAIEKEVEKDTRKLQDYVEELRHLGVESKGPDGLVDFPAMLDGRLVYLCWKLGESEVAHWHELDAGFAGRQLLEVQTVSGDNTEAGLEI